ncbi:hypothetical protein RI02_03025 [Bacillus altitudinis]|nr:hypothetical protein [Bacillus altitudinis]QKL20679.1 hypothetical protein RI02_03025 [Bacillus altitudinis]QKL24408.1 hypothetical protein EQK04_03025 [Bacillus altitudinis]
MGGLINMENFDTFTLKCDGRKVVLATSYVSPLGNIMKIAKELSQDYYNGEVLFDLLLSNGFANNRFLIMQFDGKKFILNSKRIVKDIPDGILKEIYNRYNDNPQWIDQSSLLDVHKEVLRQNFLLIS